MRPISIVSFILIIASFYSCSEEFGTTTVTYTRAEAVYKPVSEVRINEFNSPVRNVEEKGKIYVGEDYLLLGELDAGIHVFDNSDPESPQKINFIQIPGNYDFFVEGDNLYANNYFDLVKLDISDPSNVQLVNRHSSGLIKDESIKYQSTDPNNQLVGFSFETITEDVDPNTGIWEYLQSGHNTIYFDHKDEVIPPSSVPSTFVGSSSGQAGTTNRIAVHKDKLYILMRNRIEYFGSDLESLGSHNVVGWGLETLYEYNDHLYVGTDASMIVYEISDQELLYRGQFNHARACDPVLPISDNIAYVTTRSGGNCPGDENRLYVVRTNTAQSQYTELQRFNLRHPFGMAVVDGKLFVAESELGLSVLDAQNPENLNLLGTWNGLVVEDVLPHPAREDVLLISTGQSIAQLKVEDDVERYRLLSNVAF
ncbi:MAG TPA: hypothetical protein VJ917_01135 [Saprospiraceae bacterium]|nr:hypothetical protein [Saprospiraceae bacterium]